MNKFLDAEVPDVAGHLFGRERIPLAVVREPFKDAFGPHCFYCGVHLQRDNPIDHVLPWSLVGIDGLANLVLACARCNTDKRNSLPALAFVDRVLERDRNVLEDIAAQLEWPMQRNRVVAAARGLSIEVNRRAYRRGRATTRPRLSTSAFRGGGSRSGVRAVGSRNPLLGLIVDVHAARTARTRALKDLTKPM